MHRALVLCAGEGTRIRAVAGDLPKVLVPVAGRPALDHVLAWLAGHGVREAAINLHYRGEAIQAHLGDGAAFGLAVRYSSEPSLLGTAGACRPLADFLDRAFLVVYGDVLTDLDLGALTAFHRARRADLTMALYRVPNPTECGIVGLAPDGRVTRFVEKPPPDELFSDLANAGVLVAEPAVLAHIPAGRPSDFGRDVIPALLAAGAPVYGWPIPPGTTVVDMGTPAGYGRAEAWLSGPSTWRPAGGARHLRAGRRRGPPSRGAQGAAPGCHVQSGTCGSIPGGIPMTIQIYNTLSRAKEPLETIEPGVVRLYVCGVTVYSSAHVGHAMSSLVFDTLRRYLQHRGYTVRYVQNFTDVDDKIIKKSNEEGVSAFEVADRYAREFLVEQERLGILPATLNPRVSSDMPVIVAMIQELIDQGHAYVAANGDVYFDVSTYPEYGRLSRRTAEEGLSQGEPADHKDDPQDFAVWKAAKPGEPAWDAPWGRGRPGWHIECSAMSRRHLGDQIDIHGGGLDLVFPHHENEIAQSECATGCRPFARYWVHHGLLQLAGEKMSKSLGNIVAIREFLAKHEADALRLFVLSSHYRAPATLSDESIAAAEKGLERLRGALRPASPRPDADAAAGAELAAAVVVADADFHTAMDDDFGTPGALAALFGLVTAINRARDAGLAAADLSAAQDRLVSLAGVLGFRLTTTATAEDLAAAPFIDLLIALRAEARAAKSWGLADRVREGLAELGVTLEDGPTGTTWRRA